MTMQKLALIRIQPEGIVSTFPVTTRRIDVPAAEGNAVLSPPQADWEGFGFRIADVVPAGPVPEGKQETGRTVELADGVPVEILSLEELPPAPRRMVPKSLVTQRVIDAGQIDQAMTMLQMDWGKFARWAPDQPAVNFDDPDTLAMLAALDLDS